MPENTTIAVIWDMGGVIADTGPYHFRAWQTVFQEKGVNFTREDFTRNFGQRNDTIIRNTLGAETPQTEVASIASEKETIFRKLARGNIKALPGAIELIRSLNEHGIKIALASSAPIENIRLITGSLGIDDCFQAIVTGRDVTEGKPSPQGFLLAARKLGMMPERCVVIEDAIAGVAACKSAGARCLAVTNTNSREKLEKADFIVDTLEWVKTNDLEELIDPPK